MLTVDFANVTEARIGPDQGLDLERELRAHTPLLEQALEVLWAHHRDPDQPLGWIAVPEDTATARAALRYREANPWVTDVVVLGIGGSALGAQAVHEALGDRRVGLHFVDNVEPEPVVRLLERLNPRTTLVNVISKSGTTAETMAAFLVFRKWLEDALGADWKRHVAVTTDPKKGVLRPYAERHGLTAFSIPPTVGGRFSVLTPVGLVPLAFAGVDLEGLLAGARKANETAAAPVAENLPAQTALVQYLYYRRGKPISVLMPYSTRMRLVPDWFVQLHAESLGKAESKTGSRVHVGPTPLKAVGTTDQHAQVQLYREGPFDKLVVFVRLKRPTTDLELPAVEGLEALGYLFGKRLFELLTAEAKATAHALAKARRPNYTIHLEQLDAYHLGWLLQHLMWQTAILGELLGVNAFDQPGVELGKQYTYALMGRAGFEALAEELKVEGVE